MRALLLLASLAAGAATEPLDVVSVRAEYFPNVSLVVAGPEDEWLDRDAFEVTERGVPLDAEVAPLPSSDLAVSVAVDLAAPPSPEDEDELRGALGAFADGLPFGSQLTLVGAGGEQVVVGRAGIDRDSFRLGALGIPLESDVPPHQTLAAAMDPLAGNLATRRLLVFLSDHVTPLESEPARAAAERVAASGVVFYGLVLTDDGDVGQGLGAVVAQADNGRLRALRGTWQLDDTLTEIDRELTRPYRVAFRMSGAGPTEVRVTVRTEDAILASTVVVQGGDPGTAAPVAPIRGGDDESADPPVLPLVALVAGLPLLAALLVLGVRAPIPVAFAAYAAIVPIGSGIKLPLPVPDPFDTLSTAWGVLVTGVIVVHLLLGRSGGARLLPSTALWLLFVGVAATTLVWTGNPGATLDELVVLVSLVSLYALVTVLDVDRADMRRVDDAILAGAVAACVFAVWLLANNALAVGEAGVARFGRELSGPNHTAASLLLPLAVALHRAMQGQRGVRRVLYPGVAAMVVVVIALTGSRAGLLAAVVTAGVVAAAHDRLKAVVPWLAATGVALVLVLSAAPEGLTDRLADADSSGRTNIWKVGLSACREECWVGSGWGTFRDVYRDVSLSAPDAEFLQEGADYEAHNVWLQVAVELGLIGLVLALAATASLARDLLTVDRRRRGAALGAFVGLMVTSLFLSNLAFKYWWLALAYTSLTVLADRRAADRAPREEPWTVRSS